MDKLLPRRAENGEETKPDDDQEIMSGSFLNFGNIRNGRLVRGLETITDKANNTNRERSHGQQAAIGSDSVDPPNQFGEESTAANSSDLLAEFEEKLREMIMAMEDNCPEDLIEIEEFVYCYSRLTSPFYIDLVRKFFIDICNELL